MSALKIGSSETIINANHALLVVIAARVRRTATAQAAKPVFSSLML